MVETSLLDHKAPFNFDFILLRAKAVFPVSSPTNPQHIWTNAKHSWKHFGGLGTLVKRRQETLT